ncbi:hypothetical protein [Kribbella albertanoniae]|uniref:Uncharacterized protein n=1 Tax=Kribbella albertanoniae TaxID=1266829 RepID=A0A4R4PV10_9ACTN|nr:hypothetical protein [Kribbella albertanoniae]TDC26286.1 hypothetical protein E1261_22755 [Kribbella albertanoniae]
MGVLPRIDISTAQNLRLRLYPDDVFPADVLPFMLTRPVAPGLIESVVMDYPDSMRPINRTEVAGTPEAKVFDHALASSLRYEKSYVDHQPLDGVPCTVFRGTHFYATAHVHRIGECVGRYGALVSVPLPQYVLVHTITSEDHLVAALKVLQDYAYHLYQDGDAPITPQLYWQPPNTPLTLHPVGVRIDRATKVISYLTPATNDLMSLWTATNPNRF